MKLKYIQKIFLLIPCVLIFGYTADAQVSQTRKPDNADTSKFSIRGNRDSIIEIGFGVQPKRNITSAISIVHGEAIEKGFRYNLGSALFGQLAGVTLLQGGSEPGVSAPTLYGRGRNTFNAGSGGDQPLLVIDGFLSGGTGAGSGFMQLVPEEVESVSFLKDAGATAVYGMRAANGVILVTTKKGYISPLKVSFSTSQGLALPIAIPKVLNSFDYANLYNEALANDGLALRYQPSDIAAYRDRTDPYGHPSVDWYDQVLRNSVPVSSYNLTFRGGDKTTKYFVLLNALTSQGLYKKFGDISDVSTNSTYARYNFRTNLDINLSKRLGVSFKIGGTVEQKNNPFDYNATSELDLISRLPPNAFPVYNPNGTYSGSNTYGSSGVNSNPLANLIESGFYQTNGRTLQTSLRLTQQLDMLTPGLSISGAVSMNNYFNAGTKKSKNYAAYSYATSLTAAPVPFGLATSLTGAEESRDQYRNFILQGSIDYKRTFGKHDFAATGVIYNDNINLPGLTGNSTDPFLHNGGAGRLTYVYGQKYIAEVSAGVTGSNNFPAGKRYGIFPAGSVGWILSNEQFLTNNKSINFLKIRGSYGLTGNDNIAGGRYQFTQTYANTGTSGVYYFGTANNAANGYAETTLANPNVTWEKERSANIGLDATIFNSFDFSIDVFNRDRSDIEVTPNSTLPQFLGIIAPLYNLGKANDRGIDATIQFNSNKKHEFKYNIAVTFSYAKSKVVFNAEALQLNANLYSTGYQIGQPFRYTAVGFWTQDEVNQHTANPASIPAPPGVIIRAGDLKFADIGGPNGKPDGIIDGNDVSATSNTNVPNYTAGLHLGFNYKGFDLDMVFQAVTGVSTYLSGNYFTAFNNNAPVSEIALGRWTPETASTATYPRLSTVAASNSSNFRGSTFFERDGSFIKLRTAELGYTIPSFLSSKIKLNSARLFITGTNIFSLDYIPYGDPESLTGYPVLRTMTLGLKIQL